MSNLKTQAILLEQARAKAKRAQKAKNEEIKINVFLHHGDKVVNPQTGEEYTISEWQDKKSGVPDQSHPIEDNSEQKGKSNGEQK